MYDFLFDIADREPIRPRRLSPSAAERSDGGVFMTRYQKERQRVYDRAQHMVDNLRGHPHREIEDAKAEAGLVRNRARISRAQGDELMSQVHAADQHGSPAGASDPGGHGGSCG